MLILPTPIVPQQLQKYILKPQQGQSIRYTRRMLNGYRTLPSTMKTLILLPDSSFCSPAFCYPLIPALSNYRPPQPQQQQQPQYKPQVPQPPPPELIALQSYQTDIEKVETVVNNYVLVAKDRSVCLPIGEGGGLQQADVLGFVKVLSQGYGGEGANDQYSRLKVAKSIILSFFNSHLQAFQTPIPKYLSNLPQSHPQTQAPQSTYTLSPQQQNLCQNLFQVPKYDKKTGTWNDNIGSDAKEGEDYFTLKIAGKGEGKEKQQELKSEQNQKLKGKEDEQVIQIQ